MPGIGPLKHTHNVVLELSNRCILAPLHKKCPLNLAGSTPIVLPTAIIEDVIETLAKHQFVGVIDFSNYNEPLIDPRLFDLAKGISKKLPSCRLRILTNGYYLDQTMLYELARAGINLVTVSCYSKRDYQRMAKLKLPKILASFSFNMPELDDRLCHYERENRQLKVPCHAPLKQIVIACEGNVALCCFDWKRHVTFGSLHNQTFESVISNGKMHKVYSRLKTGDRYLPFCKTCVRLLHSGNKRMWKKRLRKTNDGI